MEETWVCHMHSVPHTCANSFTPVPHPTAQLLQLVSPAGAPPLSPEASLDTWGLGQVCGGFSHRQGSVQSLLTTVETIPSMLWPPSHPFPDSLATSISSCLHSFAFSSKPHSLSVGRLPLPLSRMCLIPAAPFMA